MSLEDQIKVILNREIPPIEQAVSQGIVMPLVGALNWPVFEPSHVCPEYKVHGMRVDFALCVKPNKPDIFIEVKQPGGIDISAIKQLLNYAFHEGVRVAVATDGYEWYFYWPSGKGNFESRKFCGVNLRQQDATEVATKLQRYLLFDKVANGDAFVDAENDLKKVQGKRAATACIPDACKQLLQKERAIIVNAISNEVKDMCGFVPDEDDVIKHLESLVRNIIHPPPDDVVLPPVGGGGKDRPTNIKITFPNGQVIDEGSAKNRFLKVLQMIGFAEAAQVGLKRDGYPLISKENRPGWAHAGEGFFVFTGTSTVAKISQLDKISRALNLGLKIEQSG